jgi:hypothetical protein
MKDNRSKYGIIIEGLFMYIGFLSMIILIIYNLLNH